MSADTKTTAKPPRRELSHAEKDMRATIFILLILLLLGWNWWPG